jgi:hypothetical protein
MKSGELISEMRDDREETRTHRGCHPTGEAGDVHLGEVPGLQHHHRQPAGARLVAQGHQELPAALGHAVSTYMHTGKWSVSPGCGACRCVA